MKTMKQRKREILDQKFRKHFHSAERVKFFRDLPCEVLGDRNTNVVVNAHTKAGGVARKGPYASIVPLGWFVHHDFDTMWDKKFEAKYGRTKQSIRDRAPHYHQLWLDSRGDAA